MARKVVLYSAVSLNSKIADQEGSVAWLETLPHKEGEDYGYQKFYDSIDTTVMGYSTYAQLKSWDIPFPYKEKKNFVVTRKSDRQADEDVEFITENLIDTFKNLKQQEGGDIWLVGGGEMNKLFLNEGLVDELIVHQMPIILDGGIDLFAGIPTRKQLELIESKIYSSGVVELHYKIIEQA